MKNYLKRTWKNKVAAIALSFVGYMSMRIDGDGTAFVLFLMISIPLIFINENIIIINRKERNK